MSRLVLVVGVLFLWGGAFANFVDRMEQRVKDVVDRDVKPALGLGDQNPATLFCATGSSPAIAITFSSEAECAAYQAAQVQGATVGTTFSNCSVSTWCSTFTAGISGSTKGFTVVGVSVYSANNGAFDFEGGASGNATCAAVAVTYGNSYLPGQCVGDVLTIKEYGSYCPNIYCSFNIPHPDTMKMTSWSLTACNRN